MYVFKYTDDKSEWLKSVTQRHYSRRGVLHKLVTTGPVFAGLRSQDTFLIEKSLIHIYRRGDQIIPYWGSGNISPRPQNVSSRSNSRPFLYDLDYSTMYFMSSKSYIPVFIRWDRADANEKYALVGVDIRAISLFDRKNKTKICWYELPHHLLYNKSYTSNYNYVALRGDQLVISSEQLFTYARDSNRVLSMIHACNISDLSVCEMFIVPKNGDIILTLGYENVSPDAQPPERRVSLIPVFSYTAFGDDIHYYYDPYLRSGYLCAFSVKNYVSDNKVTIRIWVNGTVYSGTIVSKRDVMSPLEGGQFFDFPVANPRPGYFSVISENTVCASESLFEILRVLICPELSKKIGFPHHFEYTCFEKRHPMEQSLWDLVLSCCPEDFPIQQIPVNNLEISPEGVEFDMQDVQRLSPIGG